MSTLQKAKEIHSNILKTASKFISPSLSDYFRRLADSKFNKMKNGTLKSEDYIKESKDLAKALDRVSGIYNVYGGKANY